MGDTRGAYRFLVGIPGARRLFGRPWHRNRRIILKFLSKK